MIVEVAAAMGVSYARVYRESGRWESNPHDQRTATSASRAGAVS
jgi:hypothetical protein